MDEYQLTELMSMTVRGSEDVILLPDGKFLS